MLRLTVMVMLMTACVVAQAQMIDFNRGEDGQWTIVNDTVMGGVSSSRFYRYDDFAVFEGVLSLDNNGGFASVRRIKAPEFAGGSVIKLRVRGDGRKYQFRLKSRLLYWGAAYVAEFQTIEGKWQDVELVESDFTARYRGRFISGAPPLKFSDALQLGFLLGDKTEGVFRLDIAYIQNLEDI